jgi:hypothetical protein
MSLQQAYHLFFEVGYPLSHYIVYSYLRRLGYFVFRASDDAYDNKPSSTTGAIGSTTDDDGGEAGTVRPVSIHESVHALSKSFAGYPDAIKAKLHMFAPVVPDGDVEMDDPTGSIMEAEEALDPKWFPVFDVYPPVKPFSKKNKGLPLFKLIVCGFVVGPPFLSMSLLFRTYICVY